VIAIWGLRAGGRISTHFELRDHDDNRRILGELVGGGPLLLHTYRGWWCPTERTWFRQLVALREDTDVAATGFVSLSVDPPEVGAAFRLGLTPGGHFGGEQGAERDQADERQSWRRPGSSG
jgi:hypothetical protein